MTSTGLLAVAYACFALALALMVVGYECLAAAEGWPFITTFLRAHPAVAVLVVVLVGMIAAGAVGVLVGHLFTWGR